MKLKTYRSKAEETIISTKQQATEWENVFTNYTFNRRLISKPDKELIRLPKQKTAHQENK